MKEETIVFVCVETRGRPECFVGRPDEARFPSLDDATKEGGAGPKWRALRHGEWKKDDSG